MWDSEQGKSKRGQLKGKAQLKRGAAVLGMMALPVMGGSVSVQRTVSRPLSSLSGRGNMKELVYHVQHGIGKRANDIGFSQINAESGQVVSAEDDKYTQDKDTQLASTAVLDFLKQHDLLSSNTKVPAHVSGDLALTLGAKETLSCTLFGAPFTATPSTQTACEGQGGTWNAPAPSNATPTLSLSTATLTITEDTTTNLNLSAADFGDTDNEALTATLVLSAGTFSTVADGSGVSVTETKNSDTQVTLIGLPGNLDSYLDTTSNLQYTPVANANGAAAATLTIAGGDDEPSSFTTATVTLDITAVNDAPVVAITPTSATVTEDTATDIDLSSLTTSDQESDNITLNLVADSGTLTAADGNGTVSSVTISNSPGATLTFVGTGANLQTFFDTTTRVNFTTVQDSTSNVTLTMTPNDADTGTADTVTLSVTGVNDAPTVSSLPSTLTFTEDTQGNVTLGAAAFADVDGDNITATITASAGTFAAPADGAGTGSGVTENLASSTVITLIGAPADINTYLDTASNIQYTPASNVNGSAAATFIISGEDTNTTSLSPASNTVTIDVTATNDAPTVSSVPSTLTFTEDTQGNVTLGAAAFADIDDAAITATITADSGTFATPADGAGVGGGVTETLASSTVITLVGAPADINTYLDTASNIQYTPASNVNGNAAATFTVIASDDEPSSSATSTVTIDVTAQNDAPTVSSLPATLTFTEDTQGNVTLGAAAFADVDGDSITATLTADSGTFATPADGAGVGGGVTENLASSTVITLVGAPADINTYLDTASNIQYTPASNVNGSAAATFVISGQDTGAASLSPASNTVTIDVTATNDAPTVSSVPSTITIAEDTQSNIDLSAGVVADIDDAAVTVTLTAGSGTFATPADGAGTGGGVTETLVSSTVITLVGAPADINTYLDTASNIQYTPVSNADGAAAATVTVVASDDEPSSSSASSVTIDITGANDAPTVSSLPSTVTVTEDASSNVDLSAAVFADVDSGDSMTVTLTAGSGTFGTPADGAGNSVTETLVSSTVITLVGTAANINTYLDTASNITYTSANNASGSAAATFVITGQDAGSAALSPASNTVTVDITATNDAPTVSTLPSTITITEDTQSNVDLGTAVFADIDGENVTVTLTAGSGTFATPADGAGVGGGVTETLVSGTVITLVGAPADINTYLDTASNIQYTPVSNASGAASATLTVSGGDDEPSSFTTSTVTIDITNTNDAPTLALSTSTLTFTEDTQGNVSLTDADFTDVDGENITATLTASGGTFATPADGASIGSGVTETLASSTVITLVGLAADLDTYFNTASNIQYTPATDVEGAAAATITLSGGDDEPSSFTTATVTIDITASNDAPTVTGASGSTLTVVEDTSSTLALAAVEVADVDTSTITLSLAASAGTFTATSGGSVTVTNSGTSTLSLEGTPANINSFLDTASNISYTTASNSVTAVSTVLTPHDGSVAGTAQTLTLAVTAVNDEPTLAIGSNQSVGGDGVGGVAQTVATFASMSNDGDADATQAIQDFIISEASDSSNVVSGVDISNDGTLTFTPADGVDGAAVINVQVQDDGGTANSGDDTSQTSSFTITVDTQDPTISEATAVSTNTADTTPNVVISSSEAGTISIGGSCGVHPNDDGLSAGNNTFPLTASDNSSALSEGTYSNCTAVLVDNAGNTGNTITLSEFTVDTTAPTLAEVGAVSTPTNDATPAVTLSTDEAGTLSIGGSCGTTSSTTISSSGTFSIDLSGTDNSSNLSDGTYSNCTVQIQDAAGNTSSAITLTSFEVDGAAPTLASSTPADNATLVNVSNNIVLTMSENAAMGAGTITLVNTSASTVVETFTSANATVSGTGVTLNPTSDLSAGTNYAIQVASNAITDSAGNAFAGISDNTTLNFTTSPNVVLSVDDSDISENGGKATITAQLQDGSGSAFTATSAAVLDLAVTTNTTLSTDVSLAGDNFDPNDGTLTFLTIGVSSSSDTIVVTGTNDAISDDGETLAFAIDSVTNATEATEQAVTITISENDPPSFSGLDGGSTYTENGSAVVIDSNATVADTELDAANNFTGSTLTIARSGGANTDDTFAVQSGSQMAVSGTNITNTIGDKFASFAAASGSLTVSFSGDLTTPTSALVDEVVQNITYSNSSDNPGTSASLVWTFNDGADSGTGTITITIDPQNDLPTVSGSPSPTVTEDVQSNVDLSAITVADLDEDTVTMTLSASSGTFSSVADGASVGSGVTETFVSNSAYTFVGSGTDISTYLDTASNIQFTTQSNNDSAVQLVLTPNDSTGSGTASTVTMAVTSVNDAPNDISLSGTTVSDSDSSGTTVGTLTTTDVDNSSGFTYSLVTPSSSDAGACGLGPDNGNFSISGDVLQTATTLTAGDSQTICIQTSDGTNSFEEAFVITVSDGTAPTLSSSSPSDNAVTVSPSSDIVIVFNDDMANGSGTISLINTTDSNSVVETFASGAGSNSGSVSISGATVTINPGADLLAGNSYAIQMDAGALTDTDSNVFAAISDNTTLNFTVIPNVVLSTSSSSISEPLAGAATVTASLTDNSGSAFTALDTVQVGINLGGSATTTTDYSVSSDLNNGTLSISSGNSSASFVLTAVSDSVSDDAETIVAEISSADNATEATAQSLTISIAENSAPSISSMPTNLTITEDVTTNLDLSAVEFADNEGDTLTLTLTSSSGVLTSPLGDANSVTVGNSGTATMTLTGTPANLNSFADNANAVALTGDSNATSNITLTTSIFDGTENGTGTTTTVIVTPVNDNPEGGVPVTPTFDMTDGSGSGTATFTEVESGITMTSTASGAGVYSTVNAGGFGGSTADILRTSGGITSATTSFSSPTTVNSFQFILPNSSVTGEYTFTVTSGNGSPIATTSTEINNGSDAPGITIQPTDWTNVTAFTITSNNASFDYGVDNVVITALTAGSNLSFTEDTQGNLNLSSFEISDVDSSSLTMSLSVSAGTLASPADGSSVGSGVTASLVSTSLVTLSGSASDIQTYLDTASNIQYTPATNVNGTSAASLIVSVNDSDGSGDLALRTIGIDVTAVNDAPEISGTPDTSVAEDTAYTFTPGASDVENDTLTFSISNGPAWVSFDSATGAMTGTPTNDDVGTTSDITISVTDGTATTTLTPFDLTVTNVNDAPTITSSGAYTILEDSGSNSLSLTGSDVDSSTLTWTVATQPSMGVASVSGSGTSATLNYTPNSNENGTDTLVLNLSDGALSATQTLTINVTAVNDAPSISGTPATSVNEDSAYSFTPTASDVENETLTFSISNAPGWVAFDTATGAMAGTPTNDNVGTTTDITITVTDGTATSTLTPFDLTVTNVNDAPTITSSGSYTVLEDSGSNSLSLTAADVDSSTLTWTIDSQPSIGVASVSGSGTSATLNYTPNSNENGTDSLVLSVTDGELTATQTVTITVTAVNDAPSISGTPATTVNEDSSYTFTPTASDIEGDDITFSVTNAPNWAAFNTETGSLFGTPTNSNVGTTSNIVITASDGTDSTDLAAFSIEVINVNDAPSITGTTSFTINEDSGINSLALTATDVDNSSLTWAVVQQGGKGSSSISGSTSSSVLSYTPDPDDNGTDNVVVSVTDGEFTDTATITVTINPVNDAPVISGTPDTQALTGSIYSFTPDATDRELDDLTFSVSNQPGFLSFDTTDGTLRGTPEVGDIGTYSNIVISVTDGTDTTDLAAFSIEVVNGNVAPVATNVIAETSEDNSVNVTLQGSDEDNDSLTYSVAQPTNGSVTVNGDVAIYTPNADFNGSDSFVYTVSDGLESASATVSMTVTAVNDAPVIAGTPSQLAEVGTEYTFQAQATDVDNDTLTYSAENLPAWLTISESTGLVSGTPDTIDAGTFENIIISVTDGTETVSLAAFSIEVIDPNVNVAPIATDVVSTTNEDSEVAITLVATDSNDDPLTYTLVSEPTNGSVTISNDVATYIPTPDFNGNDSFTYLANDGLLQSQEATVTVTVTPVNDAPVIAGTPATQVASNASYSFTPEASDVDGDNLIFSVENLPGWAAFDTATGAVTGTPGDTGIGLFENILISVTDGQLSTTLAAFNIEVIDANANNAPVAEDVVTITAEDTALTFTLTATDQDGDDLLYSIPEQPQFGTVELNGAVVVYTPSENVSDVIEVLTFTASDGIATSNTANINITITPVNDAPVIEGTPVTNIRVNQQYSFVPTASDVENDTLTFTVANLPRWANFDANTGELSGTPTASDVGTYGNITISVTDGTDTTDLAAFNIEVLANEAPIISGSSVSAVEVGNAYEFAPVASDPEGDTLVFSIVNQPGWAAFDTATGILSGTPTTADIGNYTGIVISVSDGTDATSLPAFDLEVCEICGNVAPTISGTPADTVVEGSAYSFIPVASDSNNDVLTFSITNQPGWSAFDTSTGALTGLPGATDVGVTTGIVISVTDGEFTASLPAFSITVDEFNDVPTITGTPETSVFRDVEYLFTPTASDPEGDTLTFSIVNQPIWAAFNPRTGTLRGTPDRTEVGTYADIVISVSDGVNTSSLDAFAVEVLASNSVPVISGSPRTGITQGEVYSFTPEASDADGDTLTFSASGLPGWLSIDTSTGTLSGTPQDTDVGTTGEIIITVNDGQDSASLTAFTIEVTSANTVPVAVDSSATVVEDGEVAIVASATDADGDGLTLTLVSEAANGSLSATERGWIYTPDSNFTGSDVFVYQASDGEAVSANATVSITITEVNDLPVAQDDTFNLDQNGEGIYTLNVVSNDTDVDVDTSGDSITIQGADANFGSVSIVNNQLEFNPGASFIGSVTLVYAIRDNAGASDQAEVDLTISGVAGIGVPVVTVPDDITVDATGLFTNVDLGVASAVDADGNPLPVSIVSGTNSFAPGAATVFWQAEDSFGTTTTESQNVNVNPLISLSKDQVVSEGSQVSVEVILNGDAPAYPITVSYSVSGTAAGGGIDHDAQSGTVTFNEGREEIITFNVFVDSEIEADESIIFDLDSDQNVGANNTSVITISEANIAPEIVLSVQQSGDERLTVAQDEGNVTVSGNVSDANPQDSLLVEWSSDGLSNLSSSETDFIFSPSDVATGVYQVTLFASDDGDPILSNTSDVFIEVVNTLEALSGSIDSDGDLIPDDQEGYADSDGDGIPDYLDAIDDCNVVPEQAATQNQFLVESEPGVCMRQGTISAVNQSDGIEVITDANLGTGGRQARNSEGELVNLVAEALPEDTEAANIGGIFDFILYDLPEEGQVGSIVLPQRQPIPANAVYRKYKANQEVWVDFIIDDNNQVFSAEGERGICPPPGTEVWVPGLTEGHWCVQLQIQDGGVNDDDGEVNGAIVDPGGVAVVLDNNSLPEAVNDSASMQWNTSIEIDVLANDSDADGDTLTVSNVVGDFGETSIGVDGMITYTPDAGFVGEDVLVYAISDGNGGTASAQVNVTIAGNRAPGAVADSATTDDETAIEINVLANDIDIDGDELNLVSATAESGEVTITDNNTLLYTPQFGFDGLDTITYVVSDSFGETATATVSVVVDGNQAPQAMNDVANTAYNTSVTVDVLSNDMDVNGDTLSVVSATASSGQVEINDDGSLTFTPTSGFSGNVEIQYTITDGLLESQATLTITVAPQPVETITVTNKSSGGGGSIGIFGVALMSLVAWRRRKAAQLKKLFSGK